MIAPEKATISEREVSIELDHSTRLVLRNTFEGVFKG